VRIDGNALGQKIGGFHGNVFEFVGDQLEAAGEFFEGGLIGVVGGDALGDAPTGASGEGSRKRKCKPSG